MLVSVPVCSRFTRVRQPHRVFIVCRAFSLRIRCLRVCLQKSTKGQHRLHTESTSEIQSTSLKFLHKFVANDDKVMSILRTNRDSSGDLSFEEESAIIFGVCVCGFQVSHCCAASSLVSASSPRLMLVLSLFPAEILRDQVCPILRVVAALFNRKFAVARLLWQQCLVRCCVCACVCVDALLLCRLVIRAM